MATTSASVRTQSTKEQLADNLRAVVQPLADADRLIDALAGTTGMYDPSLPWNAPRQPSAPRRQRGRPPRAPLSGWETYAQKAYDVEQIAFKLSHLGLITRRDALGLYNFRMACAHQVRIDDEIAHVVAIGKRPQERRAVPSHLMALEVARVLHQFTNERPVATVNSPMARVLDVLLRHMNDDADALSTARSALRRYRPSWQSAHLQDSEKKLTTRERRQRRLAGRSSARKREK